MSTRRRIVLSLLTVFVIAPALVYAAVVLPRRASNDRNWNTEGARIPEARFDGSRAVVTNVRNFEWVRLDSAVERWEERSYDLDRLSSVWFYVEPFSDYRGPAHTFLSFGFGEGDSVEYVAISVEARKEVGEHYHPVSALFRELELMYVVADERDVVRLRTDFRKDSVFLFRVNTTPERGRQLFRSMLERANALRDEPEFYNTLTSTCTTNIVDHVNTLVAGRIPRWRPAVLLPAFADELAYEIGLIDTTRAFLEVRREALITPRAQAIGTDPAFSQLIRK